MTFLTSQTTGSAHDDVNSSKSTLWISISTFIIAAYLLFGHLGGSALISPDEGRNAEVAREMSESHSWLVPTYNGLTYLDKPAFYFKTVALSFSLFGETEGAARFSSAFFGFALVVAVFFFCRKVYDQRTALLASLIVASTPLYIAFARIVIFDMTLAFFVSSTIFSCYLAEEYDDKQRKYWYLLAAFLAGCATLVKGPVGFIIPSLVVAIFNGFEHRLSALKRVFAWSNWLLFFAIVLPWFIGLSILCPDFPYYGIMKESISRFTTTEFHRTAPFYYYAIIIASTFFPWSFILPEATVVALRNRKQWSKADRLFIIWVIVVVLFFSVSKSKLPGYILTGVMVLGILTARIFAQAFNNETGRAKQILWHATLPLLLLSTILAIALGVVFTDPEILRSRLSGKQESFDLFIPTILPMAISFGIVALLSIAALWTRHSRILFGAFLSFPLLLMTVNFNVLATFSDIRSARHLAEKIATSIPPEAELVCLECMPNGLPFYLKHQVTVISRDGGELTSNYVLFNLKTLKPWPEGMIPFSEKENWLASRTHPIYLIADSNHLPNLQAIASAKGAEVKALDYKYSAALLPTPTGH